jgi:hypothetical protein
VTFIIFCLLLYDRVGLMGAVSYSLPHLPCGAPLPLPSLNLLQLHVFNLLKT